MAGRPVRVWRHVSRVLVWIDICTSHRPLYRQTDHADGFWFWRRVYRDAGWPDYWLECIWAGPAGDGVDRRNCLIDPHFQKSDDDPSLPAFFGNSLWSVYSDRHGIYVVYSAIYWL